MSTWTLIEVLSSTSEMAFQITGGQYAALQLHSRSVHDVILRLDRASECAGNPGWTNLEQLSGSCHVYMFVFCWFSWGPQTLRKPRCRIVCGHESIHCLRVGAT